MRTTMLTLLLATVAGAVQAKPNVAMRMNLVPAQCEGPPAGPCSAMRFAKGTIDLRTAKQPAPSCPKTGQPTETVAGVVTLSGVTRNGSAFSGTLFAEVQYKTTFGSDPNGTCSLAGVQITTPSLQGEVTCTNGRCKGSLYQIACLEKGCADTLVTSELVSATVFDDVVTNTARKPLAVPGTTVAPASADAR